MPPAGCCWLCHWFLSVVPTTTRRLGRAIPTPPVRLRAERVGETEGGTDPGGNAAPVADDDTLFATQDATLALAAGDGLLSNDTDPDGDALTVVDAPTETEQGGTLTIAPDGGLEYQPPPGYWGPRRVRIHRRGPGRRDGLRRRRSPRGSGPRPPRRHRGGHRRLRRRWRGPHQPAGPFGERRRRRQWGRPRRSDHRGPQRFPGRRDRGWCRPCSARRTPTRSLRATSAPAATSLPENSGATSPPARSAVPAMSTATASTM